MKFLALSLREIKERNEDSMKASVTIENFGLQDIYEINAHYIFKACTLELSLLLQLGNDRVSL